MNESVKRDLDFIYSQQKECSLIGSAISLLGWDQETYMPEDGSESRADVHSFLAKTNHEKFTNDEFYRAVLRLNVKDVLENLGYKDNLVVTVLLKDMEDSRKFPSDFVEEYAKETSIAEDVWKKSKKNNDFISFQPHLEKIIELEKRECGYRGLSGHPYNNLIYAYEEGMTVEKLDPLFASMKKDLSNLVFEIKDSKNFGKYDNKYGPFPEDKQKKIMEKFMRDIGLPESKSRMDISAHPFTVSIGKFDTRITVRYEDDISNAISSAVHESGHGLYELNFPDEYDYTVIGGEPSYGLHESQSKFWENNVGRGRPFWNHYLPLLKEEFTSMKDVGIYEWMRKINDVKPSLIRIDADEVTYGLHIILRYELEKCLIEGSIKVNDLPELWNNSMEEMLGIRPENDSKGLLQDVHWSSGSFGYFPSYLIGSIYASQIYDAMKRDVSGMENDIERGDFSKMREWLRKNIHSQGRKYTADETIEKSCGKGLDSDAFVNYLRNKTSDIYDL